MRCWMAGQCSFFLPVQTRFKSHAVAVAKQAQRLQQPQVVLVRPGLRREKGKGVGKLQSGPEILPGCPRERYGHGCGLVHDGHFVLI